MNWYFNNQGVADGPHDDAEMRALKKRDVVHGRTLVWQVSMDLWEEAELLNASWWQPLPAKPVVQPQTPTEPLADGLRRPVPKAPTGSEKSGKVLDFFKQLFKGGKKG